MALEYILKTQIVYLLIQNLNCVASYCLPWLLIFILHGCTLSSGGDTVPDYDIVGILNLCSNYAAPADKAPELNKIILREGGQLSTYAINRTKEWFLENKGMALYEGYMACLIDNGIKFEFDDNLNHPAFPWPPPRASATVQIPNTFFLDISNDEAWLSDIDSRINAALDNSGYFERSYYSVPGGFAMVTRIERIESDGTPIEGEDRWAIEVGPLRSFSLSEYITALFTSTPGYFRIIAFIVTPYPFTQTDEKIQRREAINWLHRGANRLPRQIAYRAYTEDYSCTALIYEFEKNPEEDLAETLLPGNLSGKVHLEKAKLWQGLQQ